MGGDARILLRRVQDLTPDLELIADAVRDDPQFVRGGQTRVLGAAGFTGLNNYEMIVTAIVPLH